MHTLLDKQQRILFVFNYFKNKYETFPDLKLQFSSKHANQYSLKAKTIYLNNEDLDKYTLNEGFRVLAHEFQHSRQSFKKQMKMPQAFPIFWYKMIAIALAATVFHYLNPQLKRILYIACFAFMYRIISSRDFCNHRKELERDADKFANETVGGAANYWHSKITPPRNGDKINEWLNQAFFAPIYDVHPSFEERYQSALPYPENQEFMEQMEAAFLAEQIKATSQN